MAREIEVGDHASRSGPILIILSGPSCTGKSSLARAIEAAIGAQVVNARALLEELRGVRLRAELQEAGSAIEASTGGAWLAAAVKPAMASTSPVVVDSARTMRQLAALRAVSGHTMHASLVADLPVRKQRYAARGDVADRDLDFERMMAGEDESDLTSLASVADLTINTSDLTAAEVLEVVLRRVILGC